jgi:EF hand
MHATVLLAPHEAALHSFKDDTMQALNRNLIALALGAALVAPAAFAQADPRSSDAVASKTAAGNGKGNWWQAADINGDGKLSTTEANANAGLASRFATIDANKDGFVTSVEYRVFYAANANQGEQHAAARSAMVTREVWVKLDADADSRVSLAEAAGNTELTASFAMVDSNSDGFATQDEYTAYTRANN